MTIPVEPVDADEPVELLVLASERQAVARALLAAAAEAGLDPRVVRSTSEGFIVPGHLAERADLILGEYPTPPPAGVAPPHGGVPRWPAAPPAPPTDGEAVPVRRGGPIPPGFEPPYDDPPADDADDAGDAGEAELDDAGDDDGERPAGRRRRGKGAGK